MSPFISRRLGEILGFHPITPEERDLVIDETPDDAEIWNDLSESLRALLDEIERR